MDARTALSLGMFRFHLARDAVLIGVMHVPTVPGRGSRCRMAARTTAMGTDRTHTTRRRWER
jgi:hypothetical protein